MVFLLTISTTTNVVFSTFVRGLNVLAKNGDLHKRSCNALLLLLLFIGSSIPNLHANTEPEDPVQASPTGEWRPVNKTNNVLGVLDSPEIEQEAVCETIECSVSGTYKRYAYFRIIESDNGLYDIYSDSLFSASLTEAPGQPGTYTIALPGGKNGTLIMNGKGCGKSEKQCFTVTDMPSGHSFPNNVYVRRPYLSENHNLTQKLGDQFAPLPPNFDMVRRCYDTTSIHFDNLERATCTRNIFAEPKYGSKEYKPGILGTGHPVAVPYGWQYISNATGSGGSTTRFLESERDMITNFANSIGWNTGLNLGIIDFSIHHNKSTQDRVQEMYNNKFSFSHHEYIETQFSLVLDKWNVLLDHDFTRAITDNLLNTENPDFEMFISQWGTHYAYATTMGERGSLISKFTEEHVIQLHEAGVNVSEGAKFGMSVPLESFGVPGTGGGDLGIENGSAEDHYRKLTNIVKSDIGKFICSGGLSCNGSVAGGGNQVPVLLDLRPLSDLLAPPFFRNYEDQAKLNAVRLAFSKAIAQYAFRDGKAKETHASQFYKVTLPQKQYSSPWDCSVSTMYVEAPDLEYCKLDNIVLKDEQNNLEFKNLQNVVGVFAGTEGLTEINLSLSGSVTVPASACPTADDKVLPITNEFSTDSENIPIPPDPDKFAAVFSKLVVLPAGKPGRLCQVSLFVYLGMSPVSASSLLSAEVLSQEIF